MSRIAGRTTAVGLCVVVTSTSCAFGGVNALPLPGAVASGSGNAVYHVEIANVSILEQNSPVMLDDVVVGSVGHIGVENWHAVVDVRVKPDVVIPANAKATIGQTSLLGSMHLALDPPMGEAPAGRLNPGSTIELNSTSTYPSTEQTLSSISVIANAGGLGQIGDFIHSTATAVTGREPEIRQLISRLDTFVGTVDAQRDRFISAIGALSRLTGTLADQKTDLSEALNMIPPALDVLLQERPRLVEALQQLGRFSDTATDVVNTTQDDLVRNLVNLEPTLKAFADVGPELGTVLAYLPTFPLSQNMIDRGLRGDYFNIFAGIDLTVPRLKRSLFAGTRWGDPNTVLTPAPGEPGHFNYSYNPLSVGVLPPTPDGAPGAIAAPLSPGVPAPPQQPLLPVTPPPSSATPSGPDTPVFAGPYPTAPASNTGGN